ncbi:phosphonate ABC transporter, permease protein PhnE [Salibacterium salarium]|uniref:Phosphonate ABC transporter, permease protein PhnE n=1 Tax=Salibacterium salarium TaxID=284579 RepID=A0A428MVV1_9BACI|nr:phosphonate ABC transporter, permease protein PhnE [Salibacterium salarium]RSL30261.1 phosphonate ABC transporter, permease protein PhnE [Salibacterium salarium]
MPIHPIYSAATSPSDNAMLFNKYKKAKKAVLWNRALLGVFLFFILLWAWIGTSFQMAELFTGFANIVAFLVNDFLPPDPGAVASMAGPILDTLFMSYAGVALSVGISFFLGVLAAKNLSFHPLCAFLSRSFITFVRSVPAIVWGILLVAAIGLGPLAGTIALGLSGVGILGKAYADLLEEIDESQLEAVRATGASWFQVFGQAVWPQFKSGFVTWSLYKMDLNIREAAMLGVVGAGGIGYALESSISLFQYKEAASGIVMIFFLIVIVEFATAKLRERII